MRYCSNIFNSRWCPLSFFSKALKPAETRYSTYDRELLAIYLAIRHFRYFLEGRHFHVLTNHKPLIYALSSRPDHHSPRQVRHLDLISQFTTDLRHVQGSANTVADTLSRLRPTPSILGTPQLWISGSLPWHKQRTPSFPDCKLTPHFSSNVSLSFLTVYPLSATSLLVFNALTSHRISGEPSSTLSTPFPTLAFVPQPCDQSIRVA